MPAQDKKVQIKNYAGKTVAQARADCDALGLKLAIVAQTATGGPVAISEVTAKILRNADDSPPGGWREPGSVVGVILYPFEPRQRH